MRDVPSGLFATRWSSQILSYSVRPIWQKVLRFERKTGPWGPDSGHKPGRRGGSSRPVGEAVHQERAEQRGVAADAAVAVPGDGELRADAGEGVDDGGAERAPGEDHGHLHQHAGDDHSAEDAHIGPSRIVMML